MLLKLRSTVRQTLSSFFFIIYGNGYNTLNECAQHYGEQIHCVSDGCSKMERQSEMKYKMVNHETQFTIDFIDDKNLLEFYTHNIMQRRLLLLMLWSASTLLQLQSGKALHYFTSIANV